MSLSETSPLPIRRWKLGLAGIGLLLVGGAAGGAVGHAFHPAVAMAPTHIVAIRNLATSDGIVTIKGRVAESFGSRLVIDDGTGRTLIDAGPRNDDATLAPLGAAVSVQGRFERNAFHPAFLVGPSGTVTPFGGPHDRHGGPHGRPGPGDGDDRAPDCAAPPPPPHPGAPSAP